MMTHRVYGQGSPGFIRTPNATEDPKLSLSLGSVAKALESLIISNPLRQTVNRARCFSIRTVPFLWSIAYDFARPGCLCFYSRSLKAFVCTVSVAGAGFSGYKGNIGSGDGVP